MDVSSALKTLEAYENNAGLHTTLGMEFISTPSPDSCVAIMKTDERHAQIAGFVNGGVMASLAETLTGLGSMVLCPDKMVVGMNVNSCHLSSAKVGCTLTATATILKAGNHIHTWDVNVTDENERLISHVTVTNYIR